MERAEGKGAERKRHAKVQYANPSTSLMVQNANRSTSLVTCLPPQDVHTNQYSKYAPPKPS
jgi:hypothetical protein